MKRDKLMPSITRLVLALSLCAGCSAPSTEGNPGNEASGDGKGIQELQCAEVAQATELRALCDSLRPEAVFPANQKKKVGVVPTLQWKTRGSNLSYVVKFGPDASHLEVISPSNLSETKLAVPSRLLRKKSYVWQVIATDSRGYRTAGALWTFETQKFTHSIIYNVATN